MIGEKIDLPKVTRSIERHFSRYRGDGLPNGVLEILENLTRPQYNQVLKYYEEKNSKYYVSLRATITLWDDLVELSSQDVILITREIDPKTVGLALRLADEIFRHNFLRNMSQKDRDIALSIIEGDPVSKIEVVSAINRILKTVRAKIKSDEISLTPTG
ncbi:MAG: hypothetical protein HN353_14110 [Bdellovibrionales bacterium]|jgi:flagellar motor switch protein FliG|nr:hypothetical protein [Bdellovibrionales bacterium]MBT3527025.1 hypothetical protein [Bdellovibrionales bacterium]MBT7669939.1 hypothetical protein [Bdellovibrionales bacterium]MBT7766350.1 hypothetical protein [Bdellovibrionales bacterium]